jgi:hypothetical protein
MAGLTGLKINSNGCDQSLTVAEGIFFILSILPILS